MVKSLLDKEHITYKEDRSIDEEDVGHSSSLYEYDLYDQTIEIALGREKYTYSNYNVIYYPIYLIINGPKARIGVFEINSNALINVLDEDGDIDLTRGNIIFFSFVNENFITKTFKKFKTEKKQMNDELDDIEKQKNTKIEEDETEVGEEEIDDETDVMRLKIPKQKLSELKEKTEDILKDGLFVTDVNQKIPVLLPEETETESYHTKSQYQESSKTLWIEKFMKNNNYDILRNEGGGDCFFSVIRDAYGQIGKTTTVDKLRAELSKEVTDDTYQQYRTLYLNYLGELQSKEKEMKDIKKISKDLKTRSENTKDKIENSKIIEEAKLMVDKYNRVRVEKEEIKELQEEFAYMENIDTFEKFQAFIQTPNFWADTWAISTIEKILNIKVIILSQEAYESGDLDSVLRCGQLNDDALEKQGKFVPDYYIITTYSGNHYELVTYKNKNILKFSEIPYDIKSLVINKCMERNSGPYYLIQDFRNLKTKLGLSPDEGAHTEELNELDYYDANTTFVFHSNSDSNPKAGKGSGESIPTERLIEFNILNKEKDWRRKLSDSWIAPFLLDGHKWASVDHFVYANKFKKGFPDFYEEFSLNSESDISNDVTLAKAAAGKSGKHKDKVLRPKGVKMDKEYVDDVDKKSDEDRIRALDAKFTQNLDLKKVLMETKDAKLSQFVRGSPSVIDEYLMKTRRAIAAEKIVN